MQKSLQFAQYQSYIKQYGEVKNYESYQTLQSEAKGEENKYRELFAKFRHSTVVLHDPYLMMIPIFSHLDCFSLRYETPEEKNIPKVFDCTLQSGQPATVQSREEFANNFHLFTEGQFTGFNWENVFVAGGSVLASLLPIPEQYRHSQTMFYYHNVAYMSSDVDIFIYGLNEDQASKKLQEIYTSISNYLYVESITFRSAHAVTIVSQFPYRHIQIILRLYKSPAEILMGFDVDCCAVGYDGKTVWALPRAHMALVTKCNTIDMSRRSPSYELRLAKYADRGFRVAVPFLDRKRVLPEIFDQGLDKVNGLARLLVLEQLRTSEVRNLFKEGHISNQLSKQVKRGRTWTRMNKQFKEDPFTSRRQDELGELASDYTTVFLPWGPKWNAEKIQKLMYIKDFIINSRFYDPKKTVHTHPCFFGTIQDVLGDCCRTCPPDPEQSKNDSVSPAPPTRQLYVKGELKWVTTNPGEQTKIGSFNPITDGDWTEGACIFCYA